MLDNPQDQLLRLATLIGSGQSLIDHTKIMLFLPQKRLFLEELCDEWNDHVQIGLTICAESLQRNLHQSVHRDPVEAWRILCLIEKSQNTNIDSLLNVLSESISEFASISEQKFKTNNLVEIKKHAKSQLVLSREWMDALSVIEFGEEGKNPWILFKEAETLNSLRSHAAKVVAHIDFLASHPMQFDEIITQINNAFDMSCAFEEDVLCFKEETIEKKIGKREFDASPEFISPVFQSFENF